MKKILTTCIAVLTVMALQATVVTQTVDWQKAGSSAVPANPVTLASYKSVSNWNLWTTGADEYDQVVIEVADHDYDIIATVQCTDGKTPTTSKGIMRAGVNTVAVDITDRILQAVTLQNFSSNEVTIEVTGLYMRKAVGQKRTETIWTGPEVFTDFKAWDDQIVIGAETFIDVHAGDILEFNYELDENSYHQFKIQSSYETYFPEFLGVLDNYNQYNISKQANSEKVSFAIMSETDIDKLKNKGGLHINAKYLTLNSINLIRHDVLWTGTQVIGNWSGSQSITAAKLTGVETGNIICVRVSELTEGGRVNLQYVADGWKNFTPDVNYIFSGSDEAPMVVQIPVTHAMKHQLVGHNLIVKGVNFTMTDIYLAEGTPLDNVAAYLDVTAAKMATYVLPFNVPALPEGVKAYDLTNDGTNEITATEVSSLTADKPVLIIADEGEYEFLSEEGASDDISGKTGTYTNGALVGTYQAIANVPTTSAANYNYILQNGTDGVAFYQVTTTGCSIAPYHAYLSCGYNSQAGGTPAPMRIRFRQDAATAVSQAANSNPAIRKRMIDGQLFIEREGTLYTTQGQIVK